MSTKTVDLRKMRSIFSDDFFSVYLKIVCNPSIPILYCTEHRQRTWIAGKEARTNTVEKSDFFSYLPISNENELRSLREKHQRKPLEKDPRIRRIISLDDFFSVYRKIVFHPSIPILCRTEYRRRKNRNEYWSNRNSTISFPFIEKHRPQPLDTDFER